MSTTSKRTRPISSFESPYVSLELLSYLKSGQTTPFQIFNEIIIPDFLQHLSKGRNSFLPSPENTNRNGIVDSNHETAADRDCEIHKEEDNFGFGSEDSSSNLRDMFEEIKNDIVLIQKVCGRLERWETDINGAIKDLVLQSLDDAFRERNETSDDTVKTPFLLTKFRRTRDIVSMLKERIYSPLKFSSDTIDSEISFRRFKFTRDSFSDNCELPVVNISKEIAERSTFEEIRAIYEDLGLTEKVCLLCFSVFPENAVIKKKVLVHWWVGEGFIDSSSCGESETVEKIANGFFKEYMAKGLIEPVFKKRRPSADSCRMQPSVRFAVIMLAEQAGFIKFDAYKNPTANFSGSRRACLVKSEEGSYVRELTYGFRSKQENIRTIFNVSEHHLEFESGWFSKMKYVTVLQLGRWQSSAKHVIEVEDSEFLKGLKKMKHLRYLSLRGVSTITELPTSISKLENLRILNLNGCHDLEKLPDGIGSLKKLTHLDMYECYLISHMPEGLASLSELQVLKGFVIGKRTPGGQYCRLEDLTKLENLKKLSICVDRNSENSSTVKEELNSLEKFEKLKSLSISWSRIYDSPIPQKGFQKMLTITKKLGSTRSPTQFVEARLASTLPAPLEKLDLHYFPGDMISDWFSLGKLEKLRKLYIRGADKLRNLNHENSCWQNVKFLRLKFLSILRMDWLEMQKLFPELIYLEKCKCPELCFFPCDEGGIWKKRNASTISGTDLHGEIQGS